MVFERDTETPFDVVCGAGDGAHTRDYSAVEVPTSSRSAQTPDTSEQADWFDLTIGVEQDAGDDLPVFAVQVLGSQQCTTTCRFNWNILRFIF